MQFHKNILISKPNLYKRVGNCIQLPIVLLILPVVFLFQTTSCEARDPDDVIMFNRDKMLNLVNKARQAGHYCGNKWYAPAKELKWNNQLEEAAKAHCMDMCDNNFFSHKGSDGHFVDNRLFDQHYIWKACAENVAYGALYENDVMEKWLKSPGHCSNIMNPVYTEMGAWLKGSYWTQVFATPQK